MKTLACLIMGGLSIAVSSQCVIAAKPPGTIEMRLPTPWQQEATGSDRESENQALNEPPTVFWPDGVAYNSTVPTPKQFFGFDIGQRHLRHDQVVDYLRVVAEHSPRVSLQQTGLTHGKRPLLLATITSPENQSRIDQIRLQHRQLANPELAEQVNTADLPAVLNMCYSVHGDEPSAGNCAALVAYYLAAADGPEIESTLGQVIVLLDPVLNPDGFDRFARWANMYRGQVLNPDPAHAEHNQGWPSGRTNYYWFDLNRDWLPLVHPESQTRMTWYHAWKPNVVLDFHEMGTNSTYFFQPGIPQRTNPLTPQENIELTGEIGKYHAEAFDRQKALYFTQEVFDDFYMGKGSTYPDLHGAIGILFEQASSRGHLQESTNGLLSFPQTINNQFIASRSSLKAVTEMRDQLLDYKRQFYQSSLQLARQDETSVEVFVSTGNATRLDAFANLLTQHDIQCYRLKQDMQYGDWLFDQRYSLLVPVEQPEYRFLQSLIERRTEFEENIFYDVSAWTIPLAYNLEQFAISRSIDWDVTEPWQADGLANKQGNRQGNRQGNGQGRELAEGQSRGQNQDQDQDQDQGQGQGPGPSSFSIDDRAVGYLIDYRDDLAPRLLWQLLDHDLNVKVATRSFEMSAGDEELAFGFGTLFLPVGLQSDWNEDVLGLLNSAADEGVRIVPVATGLTASQGVDLGSNYFRTVEKHQVAMLTGEGVSAYRAGEVWHAVDQALQMPLSLLNNSSRFDLSRYQKLILVSRASGQRSAIERWVRDGGTLIALGSAVPFAQELVGDGESGSDGDRSSDSGESASHPLQKPFVSARDERALRRIGGAIFRADIDPTHPLFFGYGQDELAVFKNGTRLLEDAGTPYGNPLVYDQQAPLLAGYASQENQEQLAGTPGIVVRSLGRGRVIMINDNVVFRGFWLGTQRILFNAIYFGQFTDPPPG